MTINKAQRRARLRYLAVCGEQTSYALDYYPTERKRYLRELGREVIGDFATHDDAFDAAFAELRRRARRRTATERRRRALASLKAKPPADV